MSRSLGQVTGDDDGRGRELGDQGLERLDLRQVRPSPEMQVGEVQDPAVMARSPRGRGKPAPSTCHQTTRTR
jgi:hypothetical protein